MLSHSVTPMAYRSLSTLAQAILPYKIQVLKFKHIERWHVNQAKSDTTIRLKHKTQENQGSSLLPSCRGRPR